MTAPNTMPSYMIPLSPFGRASNIVNGQLPLKAACPENTFINSFSIEADGNLVGRFKAKCSDGTVLPDAGTGGSNVMQGFRFQDYNSDVGWTTIPGWSRDNRITLFDSGPKTGSNYNANCPGDTKISGYDASTGWQIDTLRFYCSPIKTIAPTLPDAQPNTPSTTQPTIFNSSASLFLAKNIPLAPLNVTETNKIVEDKNLSSTTISTMLDDKSITTTINYADGSSVSSKTVNGVTTNDTGIVATYKMLSTNFKILIALFVFILVIAFFIKRGKKEEPLYNPYEINPYMNQSMYMNQPMYM